MDSLGLCALAFGSSGPVTSTCALGKMRCSSEMNGMEPPFALVDRRHAERLLHGRPARPWWPRRSDPWPSPCRCPTWSTFTSAPNGAWSPQERWPALPAPLPGAGSARCAGDRRNVVSGEMTLKDPSTGCASKPITVTLRLSPQTRGKRTGAGETIGVGDTRVLAHGGLVKVALQAADRLLARPRPARPDRRWRRTWRR